MNYPLISEYIEAIKMAEENFNELKYLRPVLDQDGLPLMENGDNSVVFKMENQREGKFYAVKCFTKEQEGRAEAYRLIADELKNVSSPYLTPIRYLDKELFVDSDQTTETEFPVLLMDWVEGKNLDKYLRDNLDNQYGLEMLAYRFSQLAQWLIPQPFAHGDLKPDNILVEKDYEKDTLSIVLIDYDGMYVPAMKGQKARELGSPDFRHPQRTENDFDEHIDDFPLVSILLSLRVISINPRLLEEYGAVDRLLFSGDDYRDIGRCQELISHFPSDPFLTRLLGLLVLMLSYKEKTFNSSAFFNKEDFNPICFQEELLCDENGVEKIYLEPLLPELDTGVSFINYDKARYGTETEEQLIANVEDLWADECGVLYTDNKRKLFRFPMSVSLSHYKVKEGTVSICDEAFRNAITLESIIIPESLVAIGMGTLIDWGTGVPSPVFCHCPNLAQIVVENGNRLYDSRNNCNAIISTFDNVLIAGCKNTTIPNSVKEIGYYAFSNCTFHSIIIPNGVQKIGSGAFSRTSLYSIIIPSSVIEIGDWAFEYSRNLTTVTFEGITNYKGCSDCGGSSIFYHCPRLTSIIVPSGSKEHYKKFFPLKDNYLIIERG